MAKSGKKGPETAKSNGQTNTIAGVKPEFAVLLAVVTFIVGFIVGRTSQGISVGNQTRDISVQPVGNNQPIANQPAISDAEWIEELKSQAADSSDNADAWTRLGNAYFDTDQPELAIEAYTKSLELIPGNPNVLTDAGIMYRNSGNPERAVEMFRDAAAADSTHIMSRFNMGVVLLHDLQRPAEAAAAWKEVVALDPSFRSPSGQLVSELVSALESSE